MRQSPPHHMQFLCLPTVDIEPIKRSFLWNAKAANPRHSQRFSTKPPAFCGVLTISFLLSLKQSIHALRAILAGLERNLASFPQFAHGCMHLAIGFCGGFTRITAALAALGLVYKAFLRIELLLTGGENKFGAALLANESLVFVHDFTSLK